MLLKYKITLPRIDKYEKKAKYWLEEDMEIQWEKSKSKETSDETGFEVVGKDPLPSDAAAPMLPDMSLAATGGIYG